MRLAEHFSEILNRPPPKEALDFTQFEAMDPLPIRKDPINIEEVRSAPVRLKIIKLQVKIKSRQRY